MIICAIVAVLVAADFWLNSGKIHRGVEVGNVALGGKTPTEARRVVEDHVMGPLEEIEFSGPESPTRTASEMGVGFNVARTVNQAYAVGREGNVLERLSERLRASFGGATISARHRLPSGEGQGRGARDRDPGKPPAQRGRRKGLRL